jgi:hypothetical protein
MDEMNDPSERAGADSGPGKSTAEPDGSLTEDRLAMLLLRVLGVYFLAWAVISGAEEVIRLFFAFSLPRTRLDEVLRGHTVYLAYLAAQLAVGGYLLFGGQWVLDKVLMSIVRPHED